MAVKRRASSKILDITPPLSPDTPVWPGDTPYAIEWTARRLRGDSCNVSRLVLSPHCGAHADAPLHLEDGEADAASLPLEAYWGPARVIDWRRRQSLDLDRLRRLPWRGVERVLFRTLPAAGESPAHRPYAAFTRQGAEFLSGTGVRLVGTDAPSLDPAQDAELSAHRVFARAGVAVLENLALAGVPPGDYELVALPLRFVSAEASPVRAALRPLSRARDRKI